MENLEELCRAYDEKMDQEDEILQETVFKYLQVEREGRKRLKESIIRSIQRTGTDMMMPKVLSSAGVKRAIDNPDFDVQENEEIAKKCIPSEMKRARDKQDFEVQEHEKFSKKRRPTRSEVLHHVGEAVSLSELLSDPEYESHSLFAQKLLLLESEYKVMRKVRDGSFLMAFAFLQCEGLTPHRAHVYETLLEGLRGHGIDDVILDYSKALNEAVESHTIVDAESICEILKIIAETELKSNPGRYVDFMLESCTQNLTKSSIDPTAQVPDQLYIGALTRVFKVDIRVCYLDRSRHLNGEPRLKSDEFIGSKSSDCDPTQMDLLCDTDTAEYQIIYRAQRQMASLSAEPH